MTLASEVRRARRLAPAGVRRALIALVTATLVLALGACGRDSRPATAPQPPSGVDPSVMSPVVHALLFSRLVTDVTVFNWSRDERLTQPWTFSSSRKAWQFVSDGWSTSYVSNGTTTTEVRDQTTVTMTAEFFRNGTIQQDLMTADRARMDVTVQRHRYALTAGYLLDDGHDVSIMLHTEFALAAGEADTLEASGALTGWADQVTSGRQWRAGYLGSMTLRFDYPEHYVTCPGEELAADVRIFDRNVEIDRYRGTYAASPDDPHYTGALASQNGDGRYAVDGNRSCSVAAGPFAATAP